MMCSASAFDSTEGSKRVRNSPILQDGKVAKPSDGPRIRMPGLTALSGLVLTWLAWVKFGLGQPIGGRPALIVGIGGLIAGVHFITTGVLAELLARIYFESGTIRSYSARPERPLAAEEGWHKPA